MSSFSNYLENAVLNAVLRNVSYTSPSNVYLALFTSSPTDSGSGSEISGSGYVRQLISFDAPITGSVSNSAVITFPTPEASWGVATHIGIYDAISAGNLLYHSALVSSIDVSIGMRIRFPIGSVIVSLD